jgi:hypothetical protein
LPALCAIATYADLRLSDVKVFGLSNIPLNVTREVLVKLDDLATAETYQMVMLTRCLRLIMTMPPIKMKLLNQT